MRKKVVINFLQNITLLTLTVTAVLLLMRFPMLEGILGGQMRAILSVPENNVQRTVNLTGVIPSVHLVVTAETEFGRYTQMYASTEGTEFQRLRPLLRGAIGSVAEKRGATHAEFRNALETPGIYVDLTTALPGAVVAAWLGESLAVEETIQALALTTARETALLFLVCEDGSLLRCECALTSSAVREITALFSPNGGQFAYESAYSTLAPYTVLVQSINRAPQMSVSIPAGYSSYHLLTALHFNAHTNSRYFESSGTEVIMQAPHFLWVGTDGAVHYSSDGEVTDSLYRIACAGDSPSAVEVLEGAYYLATVLRDGTDATPLSLERMEQTERGWIVDFCYRLEGVRVRLAQERAALRVVVEGDTITGFDYYCRAYTSTQEEGVLLPPRMAVAIAAEHEGAVLTLAYVDIGEGVHSAHWFAE